MYILTSGVLAATKVEVRLPPGVSLTRRPEATLSDMLVAGDENKFMTRIALMTKPPLEKKTAEKKDKKAAPTESE